jgi:hypothetical protein
MLRSALITTLCLVAGLAAADVVATKKVSELTRVTTPPGSRLLILSDPAGLAEPTAITASDFKLSITPPAFTAITGKPTTLSGYGITDAAPLNHTQAFSTITATPTTLAGYGITDAAALSHSHAFSSLTGKPTTLAGYGIADAAPLSHTQAFSTITATPTTLSGYGITDAATLSHTHAFSALTGKPTNLAGYGITDSVALTTGSYSDPAWILSLAWSKVAGSPTTLSGYGITDAAPLSHTQAFSTITATPTTLAGYGITDAAALSHTHAFSSLTSKPTTLAGYGITDAAPLSHTQAFSTITGTPTTLAGYGITDALTAASQAEAEAGTDNTKAMTPLRTAQAISARLVGNPLVAYIRPATAGGNNTTGIVGDPTRPFTTIAGARLKAANCNTFKFSVGTAAAFGTQVLAADRAVYITGEGYGVTTINFGVSVSGAEVTIWDCGQASFCANVTNLGGRVNLYNVSGDKIDVRGAPADENGFGGNGGVVDARGQCRLNYIWAFGQEGSEFSGSGGTVLLSGGVRVEYEVNYAPGGTGGPNGGPGSLTLFGMPIIPTPVPDSVSSIAGAVINGAFYGTSYP